MRKDMTPAATIERLRAEAKAGRTPRYIVRCGVLANGKVVVHDALGGWVCSSHKTLALAQKRADELNAPPSPFAQRMAQLRAEAAADYEARADA